MNYLELLPKSFSGEYYCNTDLNLYDSPLCEELATQAAKGRQLRILAQDADCDAIKICLSEDKYAAWLPIEQLQHLQPASQSYQATPIFREEIKLKLPQVIAFTKVAQSKDNYYLWGGTLSPNYDCSGLIQAAFSASGIWLPRDSYQQADFTKSITKEELLPGDLIFFATTKARINHVALYLGDNYYIHSSGKEHGRNGIGIDRLDNNGDAVTNFYYQYLCQYGRVMNNFLQSIDNEQP